MSNAQARAIASAPQLHPEETVRDALRQLSGIGTKLHADFMIITGPRKAA